MKTLSRIADALEGIYHELKALNQAVAKPIVKDEEKPVQKEEKPAEAVSAPKKQDGGYYWTEDEDKRLRKFYEMGMSGSQMEEYFPGRTLKAVYARLYVLGLTRRKN